MSANTLKVLVYDLTSENRTALRNTELYGKLKSLRVRSTQLLHRLGLQCTESVILISGNSEHKIQRVIDKVMAEYGEVLSEINSVLSVNLPMPIIKVLSVTGDQLEAFRELAKNRIRTLVDAHVDKVASILENLDGNHAGKLAKRLRRLRREWAHILSMARELGLDLESEIGYLLELIDETVASLRGGSA